MRSFQHRRRLSGHRRATRTTPNHTGIDLPPTPSPYLELVEQAPEARLDHALVDDLARKLLPRGALQAPVHRRGGAHADHVAQLVLGVEPRLLLLLCLPLPLLPLHLLPLLLLRLLRQERLRRRPRQPPPMPLLRRLLGAALPLDRRAPAPAPACAAPAAAPGARRRRARHRPLLWVCMYREGLVDLTSDG